jgi:hypothetical protein
MALTTNEARYIIDLGIVISGLPISSTKGVIKVILFTFCILDPDVISLKHDPLVGIGIFCLDIKSQRLNRSRVVKWLMAMQQPIRGKNKYTVFVYIRILSEHKSMNFVSTFFFNLRSAQLPKVGHSEVL